MPKTSSLANTKPRKRKAGGLTRRQRTTALRRRAGYGTIALVPNGLRITCRESDGFVNLAEIFAAEAEQRGGKPKRLNNWMRLKSSRPYLEAVGLGAGIPPARLLETGMGSRDSWAHPQVAREIAGWLFPRTEQAQPKPSARHLYAIRCPFSGFVKLGISSDVQRRLRSLQTGFPGELSIEEVVPAPNGDDDERRIHRIYAGRHVRGEWYDMTGEAAPYLSA